MTQRCPKFHVQPTTKRFRTMMRGSARQAYMMPSFQYRSLLRSASASSRVNMGLVA
jgi:hypothetical protein